MEVFRIGTVARSGTLVSTGNANRWNRKGQSVIYAASSRSLATLELLVHRNAIPLTRQFRISVISIPDDERFVRQVRINELPLNWRTLSAYPRLQDIGGRWYEQRETLLLKVPSVIIPREFNFVINAEHPGYKEQVFLIRQEEFLMDERLS